MYYVRPARMKAMLQAGACGVSVQMGRHASEAAGSSSSKASHSRRAQYNGLTEVWLQHAWKLPAGPHLAVEAEGMIMPSAQKRHLIKDAVERSAYFSLSAGSVGQQACQRSCLSSDACDSSSYEPVSKQVEA